MSGKYVMENTPHDVLGCELANTTLELLMGHADIIRSQKLGLTPGEAFLIGGRCSLRRTY